MRTARLLALLLVAILLTACPDPVADDDDDAVAVDPSPPGPTALAIVPAAPRSIDDLTAQVIEQPTDPDGDLVGVRISWTVDGQARSELAGAMAVVAELTARDQVWEVRGVPYDAAGLEGPPATASATIGNSPPGSPTVIVSPPEPVGGEDALVCILQAPGIDPDGDEVTHSFAWQVNGTPYPAEDDAGPATTVEEGDTVPREDTNPSETWTCLVTPADAEEEGEPGAASVTTELPPPVVDWSLEDVNPTSGTFAGFVSPRDYLEKVSGWAFLHST